MSELIQVIQNEVVLYRRDRSAKWQARLKLADKSWRRVSTKERDVAKASKAALKLYYDAELRLKHQLPQNTRRFDAVADAVIRDIKAQLDAGQGKSVYHSYITSISLYLKPFFGKHNIDSIKPALLQKFDTWRIEKMGKTPVASTITNHNSALNRIFDYALERGWITRNVLPKLSNKGKKSEARPAFTLTEYKRLTSMMVKWCKQGHMSKTRDMRELLRDYVLILANTGIRHGTEAMSLKWRHIEWITKDGERYLRITVNGKTGPHSLIARMNTEDYLKRIQTHFPKLAKYSFDELLKQRVDEYVFRLPDGSRTKNLSQSFRQLMRDTELAVGAESEKERTLYSLRHTYATFALKAGIGIHELAKQMGTSVAMLEKHYSKITPELMAEKFGGKRHAKEKTKSKAKSK
jgi:integrase